MDLNVPALEKLLDYVASGIGSVAGPMLAPWKARRETKARLIDAKAKADELVVQARGQTTALQLISDAQAKARDFDIQGQMTLNEAVNQTIQFQSEKRQRNIRAVVNYAATVLENKGVPNCEPDHDWTARFFNEVQDVSSEEMQILWARVLAGKVERPDVASIKTLGILRNLDQNTAALFKRLCSLSVSIDNEDSRVPTLGGGADNTVLEKYGLGLGKLIILEEYGLIISNYDTPYDYVNCIGRVIQTNPILIKRIRFKHQGRFWFFIPSHDRETGTPLMLYGVALTQSGRELLTVVDIDSANDYTQNLMDYIKIYRLKMTETASGEPQVLPPP